MSTNPEITDELIQFLRDRYSEEIAKLAQHYPREQRSLRIDYDDVFRHDPDLADDLLDQPARMLDYFEEALRLYDLPIDVSLSNAHVRVFNLPDSVSLDVEDVSRHENIGSLLDVRGQVQKVSAVKPRVMEAAFECQRCGTRTDIPQVGEQLEEPHEFPQCERQGPFRLNSSAGTWTDHQLARVQQPPERTKGGEGDTMDVHLEDDLIQEFEAGDRVTLTGILDVEDPAKDQKRDVDTTVDARAVVREQSDYEDIDVDEHLDEIEAIASGEYDHLCAWDDTRLARDQFYWEMKRAALLGGCELAFVEEPPEDELTFRVQRAVESDVKRREIQKSKAALEEREEQGHDQGRPPFGLTYDDAGERWIPDRERGSDERIPFQKALDAIQARENGLSWRDVAGETGVNKNTARRVWERRDRYLQEAGVDA